MTSDRRATSDAREQQTMSAGDRNLERVPEILVEAMGGRGYAVEQVESALRLWDDYVEAASPKPRKPSIYAASVDYAFGRVEGVGETQMDVMLRYDASMTSISRRYQEIWEALDLVEGDERYATDRPGVGDEPAGGPGWHRDTTAGDVHEESILDTYMTRDVEWDPDEIEPLERPARQIAQMRALSRGEDVWEIGRVVLPMTFGDTGPGESAVLTVCCQRETDYVLQYSVSNETPPEDDVIDEWLLDFLFAAMHRTSDGRPRRPRSVVVDDELFWLRARDVCDAIDVELLYDDTPVVENAVEIFIEHNTNKEALDERSYFEEGVSEESVAAMYAAAAEFWSLSPWDDIIDVQLLEVRLERWGFHHPVISLMSGGPNDTRAILVFDDTDAWLRFIEGVARGPVDRQRRPEPFALTSINFASVDRLSRRMRKEAMQHGWPVASPRAYPEIVRTSLEHSRVAPTEESYLAMAACTRAVAAFYREHGACFEDTPDQPVRLTVELDDLPGAPTVEVLYPHPEIERLQRRFGHTW
jgi:hypothetical protein